MTWQKKITFFTALALIVCTSGLLVWLKAHQKLGLAGLNLDLPERVLEYQSVSNAISTTELKSLPPDTSFSRRIYSSVTEGQTNDFCQLGIVLMGTDRTSIHKPQYCLTGQGWTIEKSEVAEVPITRPHPYNLPVMKLTASKPWLSTNGQPAIIRGLYTYWFVADNALTPNHWQRMWWMAKELFRSGTLQRWAYVSCFAICEPGREDLLFAKMQQFLAVAVPQFQKATLPGNTVISPSASAAK